MHYRWPPLAKRSSAVARALAIAATFVLFALGHRYQAQAQSAMLSCYTYGSCELSGYNGYGQPVHGFGDCDPTGNCWCDIGSGDGAVSVDCRRVQ